jgi:hypothetical protein
MLIANDHPSHTPGDGGSNAAAGVFVMRRSPTALQLLRDWMGAPFPWCVPKQLQRLGCGETGKVGAANAQVVRFLDSSGNAHLHGSSLAQLRPRCVFRRGNRTAVSCPCGLRPPYEQMAFNRNETSVFLSYR